MFQEVDGTVSKKGMVKTMQYDEVKELISIFEKTDLNDMEVQLDNAVVRLNRGPVSPWAVPSGNPVTLTGNGSQVLETVSDKKEEETGKETVSTESSKKETQDEKIIKAPIVGTFYASPSPEDAAYVKVGDTVEQGQVVCIIEAMKFMNEVNSPISGTIEEILVKDGEFVEFGQELFRLK